jgi:hypothetical protein
MSFTTKQSSKRHLNSDLHITGKRKKRSDIKDYHECIECNYKTKQITNLKLHILNKHKTKKERSKIFPFYCKICDVGKMKQCDYESHINSRKHKNMVRE